ncbi:MAG TPA: hypothetical protein V6D19_11730 [Stenomitos sp.]
MTKNQELKDLYSVYNSPYKIEDLEDVNEPNERESSWRQYLFLLIASNIIIWITALAYLKISPRLYTSQWTAILPSVASNTSVNLPGIGNTSTEQNSPYSDLSQDPRENYKLLASSKAVLQMAAKSLNLSVEEFGLPKIKNIENTTLMSIELEGKTPTQAQNKANALYRALESVLNKLRARETIKQDEEFQSALARTRAKLSLAQNRLSAFKLSSGIVSGDQVGQLTASIENLRNQKAGILSQWKQTSAQLGQLSSTINISSRDAANAFALQADPQFQQNLKDYSEASSNLSILNSQYAPSHPVIANETAKRNAAQASLLQRSKTLLGQEINLKNLEHLNLRNGAASTESGAREDLFKQLITTQVTQKGLLDQARELDNQITLNENRLATLAQKEAKLEELTRDVKISEAVFSSALAKLDIGKVNPLTAYPRIQLFTDPSFPDRPSSPKTLFVLLGACVGSILVSTGIAFLWLKDGKHQDDRNEVYRTKSLLERDEGGSYVQLDPSNTKKIGLKANGSTFANLGNYGASRTNQFPVFLMPYEHLSPKGSNPNLQNNNEI